MSDAAYDDGPKEIPAFLRRQPTDNSAILPGFLTRPAIINNTPEPVRKGLIRRTGNRVATIATSKNTHDFLIGAAVSGGISWATRAGMLSAAGFLGVSMLPATLIAAGTAGAAVGSYRLYKDYAAAKAAGDTTDWTFKKCAKKLFFSTAFATVGGGMTYAFTHQDEVARFAKPLVDVLREAGVIDAVAKSYESVTGYAAAALNRVWPGGTEALSSTGGKIVEAGGGFIAAVTGFDYGAKFASLFEGAKQTVGGWGQSLRALATWPEQVPVVEATPPVLAEASEYVPVQGNIPAVVDTPVLPVQPEQTPIVIAELPVLPALTNDDIAAIDTTPAPAAVPEQTVGLAEEKGWTGEEPAVEGDNRIETRIVQTSLVLGDGTIISPEEQARMAAELAARVENFDTMRIAAAFSDMGLPPVSADPELGAYIPELNVYPKFPLEFSPMPTRDAFDAATIYSPEISPDVTPEVSVAEDVVRPMARPATFEGSFGATFEGMDLSDRAARAVEAAMDGTDQQRKDLAMHILNGQAGFEKNPELAASLYQFLLEDTKPAEGARPSQTHLQVVRDTAYIMFHGKGLEADPEAAKALLEEIAPRSRVARDMLAEWNGERVQHAAAAVARNAPAGNGGLNCEFVSAGNVVVAGECVISDDIPLKIGDRISLTP